MEIRDAVKTVARLLAIHGYTTWVVGGAVRDIVSGVTPHDFDLCTTATPDAVTRILDSYADKAGLYILIRPIGIQFGTVQAVIYGPPEDPTIATIEITTLRKDIKCDGRHVEVEYTIDILEDLARRDFTINSMAFLVHDLDAPTAILDPFNGRADLENRTIRAVGDPVLRFTEDHLRMVRACRFAGYNKGFAIEPKTWDAIKQNASLVQKLPKERLRMELVRMMGVPKPSKCINALRNTGLLQYTIPPLVKCVGIAQNQHHAEDVYEHCIATCDALPADKPILRMVGLLHDAGKPESKKDDEATGDCHFYNHEVIGASVAYSYMKEFAFARKDCEYASLLIRHHMFRFTEESKEKTIKRWLAKLGNHYKDVLDLRIADRVGNKAKKDRPLITEAMRRLIKQISDIQNASEPTTLNDLAINGHDLIEIGYTPGPQFGIVLNTLLERVIDDPELNQKEKLIPMAKELMAGARS